MKEEYQNTISKLVINGQWNREEFDKLEGNGFLSSQKEILVECLSKLNLRKDEYNINFLFTVHRVLKYIGSKEFIRFLNSFPVVEDDVLSHDSLINAISPYSNGGEIKYPLLYITDILQEGLDSADKEFKAMSLSLLKRLFNIIKNIFLIKRYSVSEYLSYDDKIMIRSLIILFHRIYNENSKNYINNFLNSIDNDNFWLITNIFREDRSISRFLKIIR
ncbi:MAG: hypothetical protein ACFFE4_21535 [Candidatus Thorarchaeota archaeon]